MRTFFGGQIKKEFRGNLATIISREYDIAPCNIFIYPIESEEFVNLTGNRMISHPIERAYIGVSHEAGEKITKLVNDIHKKDTIDLKNIDDEIVISYFLNKYSDKPNKIVLESTKDGYGVVKIE